VDSITAPPSSALFPANGLSQSLIELYQLVAMLTDRTRRAEIARAVAARAGADDLIIFVRDAAVDVWLPAPGFVQTLPQARRWRTFLASLESQSPLKGFLPSFNGDGSDVPALGVRAADASVLVLLGGEANPDVAHAISLVVPALAGAFQGEQSLVAADGHARVAQEAVGQSKLLTASLESARHALQEALSKAEAANAAKDQFLAVLSHELRTPLAPVLATASAMLNDRQLPADVKDSLEMIRRNVELEARLIDDLLDLTRISRGKMQLNFDVVDAHASIAQTLEICQSDIFKKELKVDIRLDATESHVKADPARLQQVLWNIVKNAIKFTPAGGRLAVHSSNQDGELRIDISDNGIGIDPRHLGTIFNAFEQTGAEVTRQFGGLGLGLAISKALVTAHEGRLAARSDGKGQGATFSITLAAVSHAPATGRPSAVEPPIGLFKQLKLLVVEDHPDTAAVMARLLRNLGHEVTTSQSVAGSLKLAEEQPFDLVISDLGLPDGSGLQLMRQLQEKYGLQGLAISGYGMEEDLAQTKQAGFFAHLTKPVNFQQVQALLNQFVSNKAGV
jgi:signal transduction histidine kinase/CheY-like chemotaxis protein